MQRTLLRVPPSFSLETPKPRTSSSVPPCAAARRDRRDRCASEAQTSKSCTLARLAKESFNTAQENVPAGLQTYPDAAKQLLTAIPQFTPAVDDQVKRFCK